MEHYDDDDDIYEDDGGDYNSSYNIISRLIENVYCVLQFLYHGHITECGVGNLFENWTIGNVLKMCKKKIFKVFSTKRTFQLRLITVT